MKTIPLTVLLTILLISCNQNTGSNKKETAQSDAATSLTIHELIANTGDYVGKTVRFSGLADHVCKMDGKKMFLIGENPDDRIKVTPSDNMPPFKAEMEGSTFEVTGIVKELKIDENYLSAMEQDLKKTSGKQMEMEGMHEGETEEMEQKEKSGQIKAMREQLEKSGEDHISIYSVEGVEVKELK